MQPNRADIVAHTQDSIAGDVHYIPLKSAMTTVESAAHPATWTGNEALDHAAPAVS
jgi:hypothetical protein